MHQGYCTKGDVPGWCTEGDVPGWCNKGDALTVMYRGCCTKVMYQGDATRVMHWRWCTEGVVPRVMFQGDAPRMMYRRWCTEGVVGFGAQAVSRKTPIYFMSIGEKVSVPLTLWWSTKLHHGDYQQVVGCYCGKYHGSHNKTPACWDLGQVCAADVLQN